MRVLTYNTWHGLNSSGVLWFPKLEPPGRKEKRIRWQIEQIKKLNPDLVFLQEVTPGERQAQVYAKALGMDFVTQRDQAGLKIGSLGIPFNVLSCLVILAKQHLKLKFEGRQKLSGHPWGACSGWGSFQFSEFRYLLGASVEWQGQRLLLVNTHLHHGRRVEPRVTKALGDLVAKHKISEKQREGVLAAMTTAQGRRRHEIEKCLEWISAREKKFAGVILAGDFNAPADCPEVAAVSGSGFIDAFARGSKGDSGYTWDSLRNRENHELTQKLTSPLPTFAVPELRQLYAELDIRSERIDFVFLKGSPEAVSLSARVALDSEHDGLIGSDHFALLVDLTPGQTFF